MPAEKWVAIWPDGRRVEIEVSETADGRFRADASDDGDPWLAFGSMPAYAIAEVVRISGARVHGFDPPAEILLAGEPTRAELLAIAEQAAALLDVLRGDGLASHGPVACEEGAKLGRMLDALAAAQGGDRG
jgi:hypothetical protein